MPFSVVWPVRANYSGLITRSALTAHYNKPGDILGRRYFILTPINTIGIRASNALRCNIGGLTGSKRQFNGQCCSISGLAFCLNRAFERPDNLPGDIESQPRFIRNVKEIGLPLRAEPLAGISHDYLRIIKFLLHIYSYPTPAGQNGLLSINKQVKKRLP